MTRLVTLFTKRYCGLCEEAKHVLSTIQKEVASTELLFTLKEVDIDEPDQTQWLRKYMYDIPVIHVNDEPVMKHGIDPVVFKQILERFK